METAPSAASLAGVDVFLGLREEQIAEFMSDAERSTYAAGETVFEEGDEATCLYILEQGTCGVLKAFPDTDEDHEVATISAKAVFGEMGLISKQGRSATIVAKDDVVCWRLSRDRFDALCRDGGTIAKVLHNTIRVMSARLSDLNHAFVELLTAANDVSSEKRNDELKRFKEQLYQEWAF